MTCNNKLGIFCTTPIPSYYTQAINKPLYPLVHAPSKGDLQAGHARPYLHKPLTIIYPISSQPILAFFFFQVSVLRNYSRLQSSTKWNVDHHFVHPLGQRAGVAVGKLFSADRGTRSNSSLFFSKKAPFPFCVLCKGGAQSKDRFTSFQHSSLR
jgi:hypothetical protein